MWLSPLDISTLWKKLSFSAGRASSPCICIYDLEVYVDLYPTPLTHFTYIALLTCASHRFSLCFVSRHHPSTYSLELLHGNDVDGLDVVLKLADLLAELVGRDLVVLDNQVDLQLLDAEADSDQLGSTPDQAVLLDAADGSLEGNQVGLVVYRTRSGQQRPR